MTTVIVYLISNTVY